MAEPKVWTFFYGSYINPNVLREVDYVPDQVEVARLAGFDIRVRPRANLVRSYEHLVYGILATGTHRELRRLYEHAKDVLGEVYLLYLPGNGRSSGVLRLPRQNCLAGSGVWFSRVVSRASGEVSLLSIGIRNARDGRSALHPIGLLASRG